MQPGMPAQGFKRATSREEISTNCSGRQRAITRSTSVPRHASAASIRPFERASVDTAPAISVHCTANRIPGYSVASIGVCSAVVTASNQRALSKPTLSLTRRLSPLLKASSAWSIWSSCTAIRVAPDEPSLEGRVSSRRTRLRDRALTRGDSWKHHTEMTAKVVSIAAAPDGAVWAATDAGAARLMGGRVEAVEGAPLPSRLRGPRGLMPALAGRAH